MGTGAGFVLSDLENKSIDAIPSRTLFGRERPEDLTAQEN
jgi:hypothetical protein